jgi:hypothetical protein
METKLPIFDTLDISGFINIFLAHDSDLSKQRELAQTLVNREPNSPSGQAASRWLVIHNH